MFTITINISIIIWLLDVLSLTDSSFGRPRTVQPLSGP